MPNPHGCPEGLVHARRALARKRLVRRLTREAARASQDRVAVFLIPLRVLADVLHGTAATPSVRERQRRDRAR